MIRLLQSLTLKERKKVESPEGRRQGEKLRKKRTDCLEEGINNHFQFDDAEGRHKWKYMIKRE